MLQVSMQICCSQEGNVCPLPTLPAHFSAPPLLVPLLILSSFLIYYSLPIAFCYAPLPFLPISLFHSSALQAYQLISYPFPLIFLLPTLFPSCFVFFLYSLPCIRSLFCLTICFLTSSSSSSAFRFSSSFPIPSMPLYSFIHLSPLISIPSLFVYLCILSFSTPSSYPLNLPSPFPLFPFSTPSLPLPCIPLPSSHPFPFRPYLLPLPPLPLFNLLTFLLARLRSACP